MNEEARDAVKWIIDRITENEAQLMSDLMVYGFCVRDKNRQRVDPMEFIDLQLKAREKDNE